MVGRRIVEDIEENILEFENCLAMCWNRWLLQWISSVRYYEAGEESDDMHRELSAG